MLTRTSSARLPLLVVLALATWTAGCSDHDPGPAVAPELTLQRSASTDGASSYLVLAQGNAFSKQLERGIERAGGRLTQTVAGIGIAVASSTDPAFAIRAGRIGGVRAVVPNPDMGLAPRPERVERLSPEMFSNPPVSGDDDFFFDLQWGHDAVDAPEAWNAGARGASVRVAILDSGIDVAHPDLSPNLNLALSRSFRPGESIGDPPVGGSFHHGTHVAGLVAAADNGLGVIGVAPEVEIVAVKVLSNQGGFVGSFGDLIAAIVYAADIDADVISMSLGALVSHRGVIFDAEGNEIRVPASAIAELLVALGRATTYAHQRGTTLIASAGNQARDGDSDRDLVHLPSDLSHVLSIAATGPMGWALDANTDLDVPSFFTNHGQSVISFAAPGGNLDFGLPPGQLCTVAGVTVPCFVFDFVMSTDFGGWSWSLGTSMAAPYATGVAALIIGENGGSMHPAQVEAEMRRSADDLGKPGKDDFFGAGRVNAGNAVN